MSEAAPAALAAALALLASGAASAASAPCPAPAAGESARSAPVLVAADGADAPPSLLVVRDPAAPADPRAGLARLALSADGAVGAPAPAWAARSAAAPLYTDVLIGPLRRDENAVNAANAALTDAMLGASDAPSRRALLEAARAAGRGEAPGRPSAAADDAGRSLLVIPGAAPVAMVASADGLLRALDVRSGRALWSFVPLERIARAGSASAARSARRGALATLAIGTGTTEPRRRLLVFAGGAGSGSYFGFDLSDPAAPRLLWRVAATALPGAGRWRAPPVLARLAVAGGTQGAARAVLIAGNGGEPGDRAGGRLYVLDLESGALLWLAAPAAAPASERANLRLAALDAPITAAVRALDLDGDGFIDRLYAADLGGRVWRFELHSGAAPAALASGGVFASLGAAAGGPPSEARRFRHAPDVAFLRDASGGYLEVALGSSGAAPGVQDYFYALRDYSPWRGGPGTAPAALDPVGSASAFATPGQPSAGERVPGWRWRLALGESVSGEARTYAGIVLFATARPLAGCATPTRTLYALDARTGAVPASRSAAALVLPAAAGAVPLAFAFVGPPTPPGACGGGAGCRPPPLCLVGLASCGPLPPLAPSRAVWRELEPGP